MFGFRTQYGGGKSTGFALLYESPEAMKKFEPHYRLVRYGQAKKIEKASRQQRMSFATDVEAEMSAGWMMILTARLRQAEKEPLQGVPRYRQDQGCSSQEGQEVEDDGYGYNESGILALLRASSSSHDLVGVRVRHQHTGVHALDVSQENSNAVTLITTFHVSTKRLCVPRSRLGRRRPVSTAIDFSCPTWL